MNIRNAIALSLIIGSLCCLYPGLTRDILTIEVGATLPLIGAVNLYTATRSILGTIQELFNNNNPIVGFLILLFSVIVPIIKAIALITVIFFKDLSIRKQLHRFINIISKWSMADVFVVGVFLAFLATKSNQDIHAELHEGFYFFLAYCLISIFAGQLITTQDTKD